MRTKIFHVFQLESYNFMCWAVAETKYISNLIFFLKDREVLKGIQLCLLCYSKTNMLIISN